MTAEGTPTGDRWGRVMRRAMTGASGVRGAESGLICRGSVACTKSQSELLGWDRGAAAKG